MTRKRLPAWLKRAIPGSGRKNSIESVLEDNNLPTVCSEAKCPNRTNCYSQGTATFLLMGDVCTRGCRFCSVKRGIPEALPADEPEMLCRAIEKMKLQYVVLTSVTRDDLSDGGAEHVARCVRAIKEKHPTVKVETLVPDFNGNRDAIDTVLKSGVDVFNHNIEMVQTLYSSLRPDAGYAQSLDVLTYVHQKGNIPVKTGFMVGLGETEEGVKELLKDIYNTGCDIVTIGQYLRPTTTQVEVDRFVEPDEFQRYKEFGEGLGIPHVESGPFVRSSFEASKIVEKIQE